MSFISCSVASCKTRRSTNTAKNDSVKFFSIPKEPALKELWLNLCQVKDDPQVRHTKRKVCNKHFKEDDFIDGLKARLLNFEPRILKKNAVPSLYLSQELKEDENKKTLEMKKQEDILNKPTKVKKDTNNTNTGGSKKYLSNLVPIAPKAPITGTARPAIAPQRPVIAHQGPNGYRQYSKFLEQYEKFNKQPIEDKETLSEHQFKVLKHDNVIYKKRISILLNTQEKLKARIKELEAELLNEKEDFVGKVKRVFAHVLTPNQVDVVLGAKTRAWWTDIEYTKAYTLHHLSKNAYLYVRDTLNYPLPSTTPLINWASKLGGDMPNADEEETVAPLPECIKLRLEQIKGEYSKEQNSEVHSLSSVSEGNESSNNDLVEPKEHSFISDIKPESEADYLDIDVDSDSDQSDIKILMDTNITEENEQDSELYEHIDYIDDNDIAEDNDGDDYTRTIANYGNVGESRSVIKNIVDYDSEMDDKVIDVDNVHYDNEIDEQVSDVNDIVDYDNGIEECDEYYKAFVG